MPIFSFSNLTIHWEQNVVMYKMTLKAVRLDLNLSCGVRELLREVISLRAGSKSGKVGLRSCFNFYEAPDILCHMWSLRESFFISGRLCSVTIYSVMNASVSL